MEINEQLAVTEAIIFASGEPAEIMKIAEILGTAPEMVVRIVRLLNERYESYGSGLRIISVSGGFQMTTRAEYAVYVRKALNLKRNTPLSQAAMEVLTIIAYNQPVSRGFIENIRGTDSSSAVNSLSEKELIEEAGRLDVPGKPIVYRTTDKFLRCFGLESLDDLPPLPERNNHNEEGTS